MGYFNLKTVFLKFALILSILVNVQILLADEHPKLVLKPDVVKDIQENGDGYKLLRTSINSTMKNADKVLSGKMAVPVPKDPAGGYTHERHKQNGSDMKDLGVAFQLTGEKKYALYVGEMLKKYAGLYPTLDVHPEHRNQWPGKLFWQGLNEAVWMVDALQAYDAVYYTLTKKERELIENQLFMKVMDFFLEYKDAAFDRMSNHGTWAIAAVGMTGLLLDDDNLVDMALYGSGKDGNSGFLKQLDTLFSPDGYYAEGPYYQRYAMSPFMIFAQALEYSKPDLQIMKYRDGILLKAVETLMQLTSESGAFYPINDALKKKDFKSGELVPVLDIAYLYTKNKEYLEIARLQKTVAVNEGGLEVAKDLAKEKTDPFERRSQLVTDGSDGTHGGLGLMRQGYKQPSVMFKFASQGMGHGHFDRLSFMLYDQGLEILGDYGAARFVNVATKDGGRYLPENKSWAKQSIAHNTMVVNESSHFNGNLDKAEANSPKLLFYDVSDPDFQVFSAVDSFCYEHTILHRTMILTRLGNNPLLLDMFNCVSDTEDNTYDYALHYQGHPTNFSFDIEPSVTKKEILGQKNGYQHLWVDAVSKGFANNQLVSFTFLENQRFYTVSTVVNDHSTIYFTQLGANDPNFNLRNERGMVIRNSGKKNQLSFTAIEQHGRYVSSQEYSRGSEPNINDMSIVYQDQDKAAFRYNTGKHSILVLLCLNPEKVEDQKQVVIDGQELGWKGWFRYVTD